MNNLERFSKAVNWEQTDKIQTYDLLDNREVIGKHGGYDDSKKHTFEQIVEMNARSFQSIGLDITRYIYDPASHWMGGKINNWIRFFGVGQDGWTVSQQGGTAWISKRPFSTLRELESHMPKIPRYEEVREWYRPYINYVKEVFDHYDLVFIGAVEGPITDAYSYMDMELFSLAIYEAPELLSHILDCTGKFSAYIGSVFAENASAPLQFMGEDIAGKTGPIFDPAFVKQHGLPRWRWIRDPIAAKGYKFLFHSDGRYGDFLPLIFGDFGADGLNPIERNGCNDIFEIRELYPDKLLFGNVCCAVTLPHGNVYDVEDETLELIERLGPGKGIFIGSSSEVHDLVPVQNVETMYRTVHEYGAYPIERERIRKRRAEIRGKLRVRKKEGLGIL